ncbi:MAG: amino acid ABC transporter permease [Lautropia sp.]
MTYQFDWSVVLEPAIWFAAVGVTLAYAIGTTICGTILGLVIGLLMLSPYRLVRAVFDVYIQVFRCTPVLVQIVWFYYALPMVLGVNLPAWLAAGIGLTLYMGAFCAEIFRAGVMSIEKGQWNAARSIGMTYPKMMRHVILPQAVRRMAPPLVSQTILQLKNTSLLSVVSVHDVMYAASQLTAATFRPLEIFTFTALVYFALLYPLTIAAKRLEADVHA